LEDALVTGGDATRPVLAALAALLALCGCSLESSADGRYRCDETHACPGDRLCSPDGFCEVELVDAAPDMTPDAGALADCGTFGLLRDDFDTLALDDATWIDLFASWESLEGGRLVFRPPSDTTSVSTVASRYLYHFTDSWLSARVEPAAPGSAPATETSLFIGAHDMNIGLRHADGTLYFERVASSDAATDFSESIEYNAVEHAYWRVRHDVDRIVWDTSPDGIDWTERATEPFEEAGRVARAFLWMKGTGPGDGDPAVIAFDDVNLDGPPAPGFCGAGTLTDDFSADDLDPDLWATEPCAAVVEGHLQFAAVDPTCSMTSKTAYDLTNASIAIEVVEPDGGDPTLLLDLILPGDERVRIRLASDGDDTPTLELQRVSAGVPERLDSFDFDASAHRWWGFRHESGAPDKLYIRFSSYGDTWTEYPITPSPDVASVLLEVTAVKEATGDGLGPVAVDNVNHRP
jgi:hypothetical protein